MTIVRLAVAAVSAVVASAAVIAGVEAAAHAFLSGDARFGAVALGYGLGALAGSAVASRFATGHVAMAVTALLAVLAVANLLSFPHPWWFAPLAALTLTLGWLGGQRLGRLAGSHRT